MLGSGNSEDVQAMAALALADVCKANRDNQDAVADLGGVAQLVVLLRSGADGVKAEAAGSIWALSDANAANKVSFASAGAIGPIVELLATGGTRGQLNAARAIAALGYKNVDNQAAITALLVGLLGSPSIEVGSRPAAPHIRLQFCAVTSALPLGYHPSMRGPLPSPMTSCLSHLR